MKNRIMNTVVTLVAMAIIFPLVSSGGVAFSTVKQVSDSWSQRNPVVNRDGKYAAWEEYGSVAEPNHIYICDLKTTEKRLVTRDGINLAMEWPVIVWQATSGKILGQNMLTSQNYLIAEDGENPIIYSNLVYYLRYGKIYRKELGNLDQESLIYTGRNKASQPSANAEVIIFARQISPSLSVYAERLNELIEFPVYQSAHDERIDCLRVSKNHWAVWISSKKGAMAKNLLSPDPPFVLDPMGVSIDINEDGLVVWRQSLDGDAPGVYVKNLPEDGPCYVIYSGDTQLLDLRIGGNVVVWAENLYNPSRCVVFWMYLPESRLKIELAGESVILRWPAVFNMSLEFKTSINDSWQSAPEHPTQAGDWRVVSRQRSKLIEFFRLKQAGN